MSSRFERPSGSVRYHLVCDMLMTYEDEWERKRRQRRGCVLFVRDEWSLAFEIESSSICEVSMREEKKDAS